MGGYYVQAKPNVVACDPEEGVIKMDGLKIAVGVVVVLVWFVLWLRNQDRRSMKGKDSSRWDW